jgi:hypothetical protein
MRLWFSATHLVQRQPCAIYRGLTTSIVPKQKRPLLRNTNKLLRSKAKEGLLLSREQVERIWNTFNNTTDESVKNEGTNHEFDIQNFVAKYPHVSPELNQIAKHDKQNVDGIKNPPLHSPLAEEAETKLQRMMDKIQQHSSQTNQMDNMEISFQILSLLSQELDAVVDLLIRLSNSNTCKILQQAIEATDRASYLLLKFQNMKSLSVIQFPPISIKTIQCTIQQYHHLYTVNKSTLSSDQIKQVQHKCLDLLKCMTKQVLRIRMSDGHSPYDMDGKHFLSTMVQGALPLNQSYRITLDLLTDVNTRARFSKDDIYESIHLASKLIKEMELYTHEMIMNDVDSKNTHTTNEFFRSIYPCVNCFHMVIGAYAKLSIQYSDLDSVRKANDILDRMLRRYTAYCRESEMDDSSMKPHMDHILKYVALPNMSIYESILKAYSESNISLKSEDISRVIQIWERIKSSDDLTLEAVQSIQQGLKDQNDHWKVLREVEELLQTKWNHSS